MIIRAIWLSIFILIFAISTVGAGSLYRWVDSYGVVHITDRKPIKNETVSDISVYPYPEPDSTQNKVDSRYTKQSSFKIKEASARLKMAKEDAEDSLKKAQAAQDEAERIKQEADRYNEEWGALWRTRRGVRGKMALKQDAAEEAAHEAERLTQIAREALEKVRKIEKEMSELQPNLGIDRGHVLNLE